MNPERVRLPSIVESDARGGPGHDRWLLSYADFITLLLALFVVLYASARVEVEEDQSIFDGLKTAFFFDSRSPSPVPIPPAELDSSATANKAIVPVPFLAQLQKELSEVVEDQPSEPGREPGVELHQSERGLVVSLASAEFFPAGGVEIPKERRAVLSAMAPYLTANTASVQFEGHTDAQPIQGGPYPSNWELSTARAAAVARFFMDEHGLDPKRVATTGYAEFRPIVSGDGATERARNRRVEIVILEDGEFIAAAGDGRPKSELDQLLEGLPPIPNEADESLRPPNPGPAPQDIPLP